MVILILQMRKLKFREVGQLVQRPPASKWEGQESKHSDRTHNGKHHTPNFILHTITMPFLLSNSLGLCLCGQRAYCDVAKLLKTVMAFIFSRQTIAAF